MSRSVLYLSGAALLLWWLWQRQQSRSPVGTISV